MTNCWGPMWKRPRTQSSNHPASSVTPSFLTLGQNEILVEATKRAFELAKEGNVPRIYNPAPYARYDDIIALTSILIVNETEAEGFAGLYTVLSFRRPCSEVR